MSQNICWTWGGCKNMCQQWVMKDCETASFIVQGSNYAVIQEVITKYGGKIFYYGIFVDIHMYPSNCIVKNIVKCNFADYKNSKKQQIIPVCSRLALFVVERTGRWRYVTCSSVKQYLGFGGLGVCPEQYAKNGINIINIFRK